MAKAKATHPDELQAQSDAELNATSGAGAAVHTEQTAKADPPHSNLRFTRTRVVAIPLFKLAPGAPARFFMFEGAMFEGKKVDDKKEPATLMPVTDLESGEIGQIIIGAVLRELLHEQYPGDAYVGKRFELKVRRDADKKYNTYDLFEVAEAE